MAGFLILDSVTRLETEHRGRAAYCASHGGTYAGYYAAKKGIGAVILNDAGIGREQAGIAGLKLLQSLGVPAASVASTSAQIGNGADGLRRGIISFVNARAGGLGVSPGMSCREALEILSTAPLSPSPLPPEQAETRFEIAAASRGAARVIAIDSNALVKPADAGSIVVTASHGGLLSNRPETAISVDVFAAIYNDAGFGIDNAGISRLPALDARGIAGACVSCFSARIGDARSTYTDGFISALNETAGRYGGEIGQSCKDFVGRMVEAHTRDAAR